MGVRVIVRDEDGAVVASMCALVPFITDPTIVQGIALWKAVLLSIDLESTRLQLEGDSLEIVQVPGST